MDVDFTKIKKVFFIGIGGIGISALAKMMLSKGIEVAGVNDEESPKTLEPLRQEGVKIFYEKDLQELPEADLYVYSDAWIFRGPEIMKQAKQTGKPVMSYFETLGLISKDYKVIAISGTHGKTTTTAMVADILIEAGLDPTVVVGSFVKKFGSNFRKGESEYLVVEADEYNRHFLVFSPYIGVVTNIEADHLDVYKNLEDIQEAFNKFLSQSEHKVTEGSKYLDKVPMLKVPGMHNRMNAACALGVADILGIPEDVSDRALKDFLGTWRRLEKRAELESGLIIYDDYAHHPTEIKASIQALRDLYPSEKKNLVILFQPHLYSRTRAFFKEFSQAFFGTNRVYLLPIYFAREAQDDSVSSEILAEAIDLNGVTAYAFHSFEEAEEIISSLNLGKDDVFVTMGAGEAYKIADKVFNLNP
jgi:UDP-N-acetylmuramate--alanine ligase